MRPRYFLAVLTALAAGPLAALAQSPAPTAAPDSLEAAASPRLAPAANPPVPRRPWYRPRHLILQTGGGLGMVTAGAGYSFWRDRVEVDGLVGYVPKKYGGSTLTVAAAKLLYSPWSVPVGAKWAVKPLTVGAYFSYTHGVINDGEKGQYPKGYYWFSTDSRVGPLLGSRLSYALPPTAAGRSRNLSGYYELGTNDLYLLSYVLNTKGLSPADILTLTLGLKLDI